MSKKRKPQTETNELQKFIAYINDEALPEWATVAPHIELRDQQLRARGLAPLDPPDRNDSSIGTHCVLDAAYGYARRIVPSAHLSKLSKLKPPTGWLNGPDGAAYLESLRDFFQSIRGNGESPRRQPQGPCTAPLSWHEFAKKLSCSVRTAQKRLGQANISPKGSKTHAIDLSKVASDSDRVQLQSLVPPTIDGSIRQVV